MYTIYSNARRELDPFPVESYVAPSASEGPHQSPTSRMPSLALLFIAGALTALALTISGAEPQTPAGGSKPAPSSTKKADRALAKASHGTQAVGPKDAREKEEHEKGGMDRDRKFLPPGDAESTDESGAIKGHAAWRWHLMIYPKKTIPSEPYTKARRWIKDHVPMGKPWGDLHEICGPTPEGIIATGSGVWTPIGPKPIDTTTQNAAGSYIYGSVTGRFNAVLVDPTTIGSPGAIVAYAGATAGGLWKTADCCGAGTTWTPQWESDNFVTQAVSAIEIDPNDHNTIYVGTGDFDANDQFGEGIMKSTDGGATWTQLGASVFTPYAAGTPLWSNQNIGVIKVDPNNSSNVLVGTRYDLYISHDAGLTWARCSFGANPTDPTSASNPINTINRISGILVDPTTNPTTVYVAVGFVATNYNGDNGVYKGTIPNSGCPTLTLMSSGWPAGTGNGTNGGSNVGRIRLASSRGNSTNNLVIYAQVEDAANYNALGTWVTTNQGTTWVQLAGSTDTNYKNCAGTSTSEGQDWYDLFLLVDPGNDKTLYIGRTDMYNATVNSTYSSMTITDLGNVYATSCTGYGTIHPDQHGAAWVSGTGVTTQFLLGNDGGIYAATGAVGGFTQFNNTVNATEFYAGQTGANLAGAATQYYFGGSQDNGNESWDSGTSIGGSLQWQGRANGGDGFFTAFDPIAGTLSAGRWYTEYTYGQMSCSSSGATNGGNNYGNCYGKWVSATGANSDRAAWSSPFKLDIFHCTTGQCNNLLFGAAHLWTYAGLGTLPGYNTRKWTQAGTTDLATNGTATGSVITLDVAMSNPAYVVTGADVGKVWLSTNAFTGANCTQAAANTASFACTANGSATWTDLTGANAVLPNRAILGVAFDPATTNIVYAAVGGFNVNTATTPGHLFQATTSNNWAAFTWADKTGNLPDVPAWSVLVNPNNNKQVFVGTDMGFFFTNDITAATPTWYRYQYGLPDTVIQYLAVDRGPSGSPYASTTLTAFTYGRGAYSIQLPTAAGFDPHPVPPTMRAVKNGTNVNLTYDISTCNNVNDNVYWGSIGNYSAVTGGSCGVGNTGSATNLGIPDNSWFVIAGSDGSTKISSFGTDSTGAQENFTGWQSLGGCSANTQLTSTTCP